MPLTTQDINLWLCNEPNFMGVFPVNKLPAPATTSAELRLVVNTDPDNLPGTHWIAIWRKGGSGEAEVFDSFGTIPPADVQLWCSRYCSKWTCNNKCVQNPLSSLCGIYCCLFLSCRSQFNSLDDCVEYLSKLV